MSTSPFYNFQAKTIDGAMQNMNAYAGKTLLIVNTASKCGFTSQYAELEALYQKYRLKNFTILGFPCNQFGGQEPESETQIKEFCKLHYGVTFPLFSKIDVNGPKTHPLFQFLKKEAAGILGTEFIKWNFTKFLVGSNGMTLKRYSPTDKCSSIEKYLLKIIR